MASSLREIKEIAVKEALITAGGNITLAAKRLGISRSAVSSIINGSDKLCRLVDDLKSAEPDDEDSSDF
jgi:predicted transcriptional regulator